MKNLNEVKEYIARSLVRHAMDKGLKDSEAKKWVGEQIKNRTEYSVSATKAAIAIYG